MAIDFTTSSGQVRLLLNDVDETNLVFTEAEITAFLTLEGDVVKLAAAQAIDTNANNEALASKVLRTQDGVSTDGAKLADALRKHAAALRAQHAQSLEDDDAGHFEVIDFEPAAGPELTGWPY